MSAASHSRLGGLTALVAVAFLCSAATAVPLFCQSLLGQRAVGVIVYPHIGFSCVFFVALAAKLAVLARREQRARRLWRTLVAQLGSALAAYTLLTGILVLVSEVWDDQHLAAAFWMTIAVLAHAWRYRLRAVELLRHLVEHAAREAPAPPAIEAPRTRAPARRRHLVVVGTGMAGQAVIEELRRRPAGAGWRVTALGEEPQVPYNRVRLSDALAGRATATELQLRPATWYTDHDVTLHRGRPAVQVDLERRVIVDAADERHAYDALVLATGSRPFVPPVDGIDQTHVVAFRTLADVERITSAAQTGQTAVVIGGGLLGLEAAAGLINRKLAVTVVESADRLMPQQLDAGAARVLERALERRGVTTRTGAAVTRITPSSVQLAGGEELVGDLVVVAAGIRPETALARQAGLAVARGIAVDDTMRASTPGVWAVGECAQHRGIVHGLWPPLARQAAVAAATLCDEPGMFQSATTAVTPKVAGLPLVAGGRASADQGQHELLWIAPDSDAYRKLVVDDDRLVGLLLVGDTTHAAELGDVLERGDTVPSHLLSPTIPTAADFALQVHAPVICRCASVTRETIIAAIEADGLRTVDEVAAATGASTGCGSCTPQIDALLATGIPA